MKVGIVVAIALVGAALSPAAARADAQQDQQACMNDAMTVCGQFIPDRERVAACLYANRSRISSACRAAMARYNPHLQVSRKTASVR